MNYAGQQALVVCAAGSYADRSRLLGERHHASGHVRKRHRRLSKRTAWLRRRIPERRHQFPAPRVVHQLRQFARSRSPHRAERTCCRVCPLDTVPRVPSGSVTQPCWVFDMVMSTVRGSSASVLSYSWADGTSMAAPAVSAVAALVKQRFPRVRRPPEDVARQHGGRRGPDRALSVLRPRVCQRSSRCDAVRRADRAGRTWTVPGLPER